VIRLEDIAIRESAVRAVNIVALLICFVHTFGFVHSIVEGGVLSHGEFVIESHQEHGSVQAGTPWNLTSQRRTPRKNKTPK
jgi:predicted component of type VI protein secretion system